MRYYLIGAAVVALVAAYVGYWFYAAGLFRDGAERWVAERRAAGWTVEHGEIAMGGFPFRLEMTVPTPHLAGNGLDWRGAGPIKIVVQPWAPRHAIAEADGRQTFDLLGHKLEIDAKVLHGSLLAEPAGWRDIVVEAKQPTMIADGQALPAARAQLNLRRIETGTEISLIAEQLDLPETVPAPLGRRVDRVGILGQVDDRWPGGPLPAAIAAWRDAGGDIEVKRLEIAWGPLRLTGDATLALDAQGRPLGAGTVTIQGAKAAVTAMGKSGYLTPGQTTAAGIFALTLPDGTKIPFSGQDGRLFVFERPVATLPVVLPQTAVR